jgi:hypothetical protein
MSEEPLNRKDDLQEDVRDTGEVVADKLDEGINKIKAGAKAVVKKIDEPDRDLNTEYTKEKFKEEVKDY